MEQILEARGLSKTYTTYKRGESLGALLRSLFAREAVEIKALKDVDFSVGRGEIVGILGPNGAGKSTMIKMLTGILVPTSGTVRVLGFDPSRQRSKYVGKIGAVFGQKSQLIFDIPPVDSFRMNKAIYAISDAAYTQRLNRMVELLDIKEVMLRPTRVLSLGERMKCEFIMAMLHGPEVVFLDEPTIGLDLIAKEAIRSFIRSMNAEGVTFLLTTHDLEDIEKLAHRVMIVNHGEKVYEDDLSHLTKYLGNKKLLNVTMQSTVPSVDWPGVSVLSTPKPSEAQLLVDLDALPMTDVITRLGTLGEIVDLNIQGLPIEEVIRTIYLH